MTMSRILFLLAIFCLPMALFAQCGDCSSCPSGDSCATAEPAAAPLPAATAKTEEAPTLANKEATINVSALEAMIKTKTPMVLLDARTGTFDDGKRIPGAKTLNASSTPEEIQKMIPAKDSLVVTYCANPQCPASPKLAAQLKTLGYTNVIELPEGIQGWEKAGKAIETPEKK